MAILLSASSIRKAFGARPLFDGLTFTIESGERIGLIGPNGAGKSTLLRVLAQQTGVDAGTLSFQRGLRVGFLEQVPTFAPKATVMSAILPDAETSEDWEALGLAQELMSRLLLDRLPKGQETEIRELSGGWKKRVAMARELVRRPDLLLLDEPTNHLDIESILWLEEFLARAPFATLTITHDRLFLQRIADRILELDRRNPGGLLSIKGDYATYLETKEQVLSAQERREVVLKNTLRRETAWLRRGAKARTTKQQARIQRHGELSAEVDELAYRNQARKARLDFQATDKSPKRLLEAKGISKSYNGRTLFKNFDLKLGPGVRIGLLGANGAGKSTLIRVLLGEEAPDSGDVFRSEHLQASYFQQNRDSLDPTKTVMRTVCPTGDFVDFRGNRTHVRSYLDRFLFEPGQMEMAVGKLSGGEQSRLLLALLMLKTANLLVLDEPTNDLDMATLNVLEECLTDFPGAVILVTHDRYFLDQVADRILAFEPAKGEIVSFVGLEQWETWHEKQEAEAAAAAKKADSKSSSASGSAPAAKKKSGKLSFKEQKELEGMEATIQAVEAKLEKATAESADPKIASNHAKMAEISKQMTELQSEVERLYMRWSELSEIAGS